MQSSVLILGIVGLLLLLTSQYFTLKEGFEAMVDNDPKSAVIVLEGKLSILTDPYYLRIMASFGTGRQASEFTNSAGQSVIGDSRTKTEYSVIQITDAIGRKVWAKGDPITRVNSTTKAAEPLLSATTDKDAWMKLDPSQKYMLTFSNPVNTRVTKESIGRKMPGIKYIGISFTDTAQAEKSYLARMDELKPAAQASKVAATKQNDAVTASFLTAQRTRREQEQAAAVPNYNSGRVRGQIVDPSQQLQYQGMMPGLLTNRIRVRAKYANLVAPASIAKLESGAGTDIKVTEILDSLNKPIWPGKTYTDSGLSELFTIGFNKKIDANKTIGSYLKSGTLPGVQFVSAAVERK